MKGARCRVVLEERRDSGLVEASRPPAVDLLRIGVRPAGIRRVSGSVESVQSEETPNRVVLEQNHVIVNV